MLSGLECDVKKNFNPNMTSKCWSQVAYWLCLAQYKHVTTIMYSKALSMLYVNTNEM